MKCEEENRVYLSAASCCFHPSTASHSHANTVSQPGRLMKTVRSTHSFARSRASCQTSCQTLLQSNCRMSSPSPTSPPKSGTGHYGNLSEAQEKAVAEFQSLVTAERSWHESVLIEREAIAREKNNTPSTDEVLSSETKWRNLDWAYEQLRFLRAHKWDVSKAVEGYKKYIEWRKVNKIDWILDGEVPKLQLMNKTVPNLLGGVTKSGAPLYIEKSGRVHVSAFCQLFTVDEVVRAHTWQQERQALRCRELSRLPSATSYIETFANIIDLSGLSLSHRRGLVFTQGLTVHDQTYYPERLHCIFIVNAPYIFPMLWSIIKTFVDAETQKKVFFLKSDYKQVLLQHFDADQLPIEYGGTKEDTAKEYDISDILATLSIHESDVELEKVFIPAGKSIEKQVECKAKGDEAIWLFRTSQSINFSVSFYPLGKEGDEKSKLVIMGSTRLSSCDELPVQGSYKCEEPGVVKFVLDNSFSYMRGKEVSYTFTIAKPPSESTSNGSGEGEASVTTSSIATEPSAASAAASSTA